MSLKKLKAKAHQIFHDASGLEISPEIALGLNEVVKQIFKEGKKEGEKNGK